MRPPVIASSRINSPLDAPNASRSAIANKTSHTHTHRVLDYGFPLGFRFWIRVLDFRSLGLLDANAPGNVSHENIGIYAMGSSFDFFQMACKNNRVQLIERK
jgi:hypothetical protein